MVTPPGEERPKRSKRYTKTHSVDNSTWSAYRKYGYVDTNRAYTKTRDTYRNGLVVVVAHSVESLVPL